MSQYRSATYAQVEYLSQGSDPRSFLSPVSPASMSKLAAKGFSPVPKDPSSQDTLHGESQNNRTWTPRTSDPVSSELEIWHISDSLQPSSLLSKEAQSGHFSLQNVLSIPNLLTTDSTPNNRNGNDLSRGSTNIDDPIFCNFCSYPIALGLFDNFMRCLNPYISQFDPNLHTFTYIQQKSSFLLSAILSASSKAFHPPLHAQLQAHTEKLLGKAFMKGEKSVEVVQGILVLTYWKEPDEARTWLLVGYAIRMCIEMGWHKLPNQSERGETVSELEVREHRNIQRTWLVLFVYDRSLSSQMGKPWMIEQNDVVQDSDTWHLNSFAVPGVDLLLVAFVRLRIMSSEMLDLVFLGTPGSSQSRPKTLLKLLNSEISRWETKWYSLFDQDDVSPCQHFLVRFYGLHVRLLLNSCSLQDLPKQCKDGISPSKQALWLCFTSAVGMLELISQEFGPFKLLYFAQDSVHVMTAYAATFLIKLLLSIPGFLRADLEVLAVNSIREASETFKDQCAAQKTGCAMQARFLSRVVDNYQTMKAQSAGPTTRHKKQTAQEFPSVNLDADSSDMTSRRNDSETTAMENGEQEENQMGIQSEVVGNYAFSDNEMWEKMFAEAGFRLNDGVFMPDAVGS
ncbi:fungal-specific transcription factor-like protein [Rhexocercosporidium sp. MPI-PUGE-AT-0058]|nr:fungal-specific transcription factor-like protein [Rhexocercosporidium sp. MPI-PUGE-AT-0058]